MIENKKIYWLFPWYIKIDDKTVSNQWLRNRWILNMTHFTFEYFLGYLLSRSQDEEEIEHTSVHSSLLFLLFTVIRAQFQYS